MLFSLDSSSFSPRVSGVRADKRKSEKIETNSTNFCIRDYTFALRSKINGTNWPFPLRLLKLGLKHGIRDLLPPFDPASSVKVLCSEAEKTRKDSQIGKTKLQDEDHTLIQTLSFSIEKDKVHSLINGYYESVATMTNQFNNRFLAMSSGELTSKKCLVEEMTSTSTNLDVMSLNFCLFCKAFFSTSNTTLNAHMDQCLSTSDNATLFVDNIPKIKAIKPVKKRLMADIYANSICCSLDDLNRRNGTNWATNSVFVESIEANMEVKKLKLSQANIMDEMNEEEVYVDSNGIKLRILSKFIRDPYIVSRKLSRLNKSSKHVRDDQIDLTKDTEYQGKRKCKELFSNEVTKKEVSRYEKSCQEGESSCELSGEQEEFHMPATLQKWHCSKRSDLPKYCKKYSTKMKFKESFHSSEFKMADFPVSSQNCSSIRRKDETFMEKMCKSQEGSMESHNFFSKSKSISTLFMPNMNVKAPHKHHLALQAKNRTRNVFLSSNSEQQKCVEADITSVLDEEFFDQSSILHTEDMTSTIANSPVASDDKVDQVIPVERMTIDKHVKLHDEYEYNGAKYHAGASSFTESSAYLTNQVDLRQANFSIASTPEALNQESNLSINGELTGSPLLSSSNGMDIHENERLFMSSAMKNAHQRPDYQTYCSPLHTDMTLLDSPTESVITRCYGASPQSSSGSILRLMGKNLMITHNEEFSNSAIEDGHSTVPILNSPLSFTSYMSVGKHHDNFQMINMEAHNQLYEGYMNLKMYATNDAAAIDSSSQATALETIFKGPFSHLINAGNSLEVLAMVLHRPFEFKSLSSIHFKP